MPGTTNSTLLSLCVLQVDLSLLDTATGRVPLPLNPLMMRRRDDDDESMVVEVDSTVGIEEELVLSAANHISEPGQKVRHRHQGLRARLYVGDCVTVFIQRTSGRIGLYMKSVLLQYSPSNATHHPYRSWPEGHCQHLRCPMPIVDLFGYFELYNSGLG